MEEVVEDKRWERNRKSEAEGKDRTGERTEAREGTTGSLEKNRSTAKGRQEGDEAER